MPAPAPGLPLIWRLCVVNLAVACGFAADVPAKDGIDLTLQLADGMKTTKDQPMIAMWLEDRSGRFVRTLWRFSKDVKYYKDLDVWSRLSAKVEKPADLDAVTGATIIWGSQGRVRLPTRWKGLDLLSGNLVLRLESAKDHGKHYSTFAIPLNQAALGKVFPDKGYVTGLAIAACPAGTKVGDSPAVFSPPKAAAAGAPDVPAAGN